MLDWLTGGPRLSEEDQIKLLEERVARAEKLVEDKKKKLELQRKLQRARVQLGGGLSMWKLFLYMAAGLFVIVGFVSMLNSC